MSEAVQVALIIVGSIESIALALIGAVWGVNTNRKNKLKRKK